VLNPQPEGRFRSSVPALPEVVTDGDAGAEAMAEGDIRALPRTAAITSFDTGGE
jgi:predicted RNase H-like HicB family nuclease